MGIGAFFISRKGGMWDMNDIFAHGGMIAFCLLVILGLLMTHIEVLLSQVKDFFGAMFVCFGEMFPDEEDWS